MAAKKQGFEDTFRNLQVRFTTASKEVRDKSQANMDRIRQASVDEESGATTEGSQQWAPSQQQIKIQGESDFMSNVIEGRGQ